MPTHNLRQGRIKVRSGDASPLIKTCAFTEGDFTFTRIKNTIQVKDRGSIPGGHLRRGDDEAVTFSFSAKFVDKTLRRTLEEFVWDGQTQQLTGLTAQFNNQNQNVDYPYEQNSVQPASGEAITTKNANGTEPTADNEFMEEVGALDVEDVTVVGDAAQATVSLKGQLSVQPPAAQTTFDFVYDAVGRSTLDPSTSDVKTFRIDLEKLSITDPSGATVDETYQLNHAVVESVDQAEGDEYDVVTFNGFAFIKKPTIV